MQRYIINRAAIGSAKAAAGILAVKVLRCAGRLDVISAVYAGNTDLADGKAFEAAGTERTVENTGKVYGFKLSGNTAGKVAACRDAFKIIQHVGTRGFICNMLIFLRPKGELIHIIRRGFCQIHALSSAEDTAYVLTARHIHGAGINLTAHDCGRHQAYQREQLLVLSFVARREQAGAKLSDNRQQAVVIFVGGVLADTAEPAERCLTDKAADVVAAARYGQRIIIITCNRAVDGVACR